MRWLWVVLLSVIVGRVEGQTLKWSDRALNQVYFVSQAADRELVLCGSGETHADTSEVTDMHLAPLHRSDTASVTPSEECPSGSLVTFHQHPWTGPNEAGGWLLPRDLCRLGATDITSGLGAGTPFIAVAVGRSDQYIRLCWWHRSELYGKVVVWPVEGQRLRYWAE